MSLFLLGLLAGLGVAMPLGAIGILLIREGVTAGFRIAAAGAAAAALVDSAYCVLAVAVGSVAAPWVDTLGPAPQAIAGIVLVWLGVSGLSGSGAASRADDTLSDRSPIGAFARFTGLTAINPATLVYFFALTAALN
ncbi:MAG: LysE family transporter, partial [Leifsonia flava]